MTAAGKKSREQNQDQQAFEVLNFAMNKVQEAAYLVDENARFQYVNDNACQILGYSRDEMFKLTVADIDPDFPAERWTGHWKDLKAHGSMLFEGNHKTSKGKIFPVEINANYFEFKGHSYNLALVRDITDRKRTELLQKRLNRELHAISNCNQTLLHAQDEQTLLSEICRIICEEAGYRLAWVGFAENDDAKTIRPVAWAGFDSGYIANAKLSWSENTEHGKGPAGEVVRSGKVVFVQDFSSDAKMTPWRESALKRGYHSGIALPLKDENAEVFGVLLIYSAEKDAITPDEILLMQQLSGDLAYGMIAIRTRTKHKSAQDEVLKLNRIYAVLSNINQAIVRIRDSKGILDEACRIAVEFGKFKMAWIGMVNSQTSTVDVVSSNGFESDYLKTINIDLNDERRSSGPTGLAVRTGKHKISNNVFIDDSMSQWRVDADKYGYKSVVSFPLIVFNKVIGAFTIYDSELNFFQEADVILLDEMAGDISFALEFLETETDRKKAEKELRDSEERYRLIAENTADTITVLDMDLKIKYVSPSALKLRGYTSAEIIGQPLNQIFTPSSLQKANELFIEQMALEATGQADPFRTESLELEEYCKDGSTIWVEVTMSFIRDANLKPIHILTVTRDITERKKVEEERLNNLRFFECMDRINRAVQETNDLEQMMSEVLGTVLAIFDCDRAWLFYPCDPNETTFRVPMEVTKPEYPGARIFNVELPLPKDMALNLQEALKSDDPVTFIDGTERPINKVSAEQFGVRSMMIIPLYPKIGKPWAFGLHQCSYPRIWTAQERTYFKEISRRLEDALTSLQATRNLQESELRYREIFENTFDVITVSEVDEVGRFKLLDFNPAWEKITGLSRTKLVGQYLDDVSTNHDSKEFLEQYRLCVRKKAPVEFEQDMKTATGHWYVHTTLVPVSNTDGNIYRLVAVSRNITQQKLAEASLKEFKTATQQSPASIMITDFDGKIEYVNPKFTETSGYTSGEVIGQNPRILKSGEMSKDEYKVMWDSILSGAEWRGEFHNRRKDGTFYWESASISSIKNDTGKIIHFIAVKEDITERKLMEIDLLEAKEKAEEISRLKSSLLLNMSHELRTPMNGILGFAGLLKEQPLDPDSLKMVDIISSSGNRLMTTLNSILDLAQVEAGKQSLQITMTNLSEIIQHLLPSYVQYAETKKLKFISAIEENLYSMLDQRLVENILHHLLNNAIKFTDSGSISLFLRKEEIHGKACATISIKDSGIGIPSDKMNLIFEAFRQGSEGMGRSFEGTGLGLTLCKRFVELLNGVISVESLPDIGSTFIVQFPLIIPTTEELNTQPFIVKIPEIKDSPEFPKGEKKVRVLIVEDNEQNCELMEIYLRPQCLIDIVHSGKQAVKCAFMNQYDLILMDINLGPEMDGIQATKEIRKLKNYENIPIIAVTGFSTFEEKEKILAGGLNQIISKPFTREELLRAVRSTCF